MASAGAAMLVVLLWCVCFGGVVQGQGLGQGSGDLQVQALLQFKLGVTRDPLQALRSWEGPNPCSWFGVACDTLYSQVLKVNLTGLQLEGSLDDGICGLPFLSSLDLSSNNFSGSIPAGLGNCTSLQTLVLQSNELSGGIPPTLGLLGSLQLLSLSDNRLAGSIPGELGFLTDHLSVLYLDGNLLNGSIPDSLSNCRQLADLRLSRNRLTGPVPDSFGTLNVLQYLRLSANLLSGSIPPALGNCSQLLMLDLASNQLTGGVPGDLGRLVFLQRLYLQNNRLSGPFPASITNSSFLIEVVASGNMLSGPIPVDIGRLLQLQTLELARNNLTGGIPVSLLGCLQISVLDLSFNPLGGQIPVDIGSRLKQLTYLGMAACNLTGSFPLSLSNCSQLRVLDLSSNSFSPGQIADSFAQNLGALKLVNLGFSQLQGGVPSSFGMCLNLEVLDLGHNLLTGPIPVQLGDATFLKNLVLANNFLEGPIPSTLSQLANLRELHLQGNMLNGTIPDLSSCRQLSILDLQFNSLSGSVPASLGSVSSMTRLHLAGNQLSGGIPGSLGILSLIQDLDLSNNLLSGGIPTQVAGLATLALGLNLSHNLLSGPIPPQLGNLTLVSTIDLSSNSLTGGIPPALNGCSSLQSLSLSNNPTLGGVLPSSLGVLYKLQSLAISNCSLNGSIPMELGTSSSQLQSLDLSYNNLSGPIPASLVDLRFLSYLNLSFNSLEGEIPQLLQSNPGISSSSFYRNPALCGAILGSPCGPGSSAGQTSSGEMYSKKSHNRALAAGIAVSVFVLVVILGLLVWRFCCKDGGSESTDPNGPDCQRLLFRSPFRHATPFRYTEEELKIATEGFSESNVLGSGGVGTVHKGILKSGRAVAVKRMKFDVNSKKLERNFRIEVERLTNVRHQNLVRVLGSCASSQNWRYLVLEYADKGSLEKMLYPPEGSEQGCTMDWDLRIDILIGIAQALAFLHHECFEQIVYGNLKPSNILLDADMQPQLVDYGITRLLHGSNAITAANIKTSAGYIAPEYSLGSTPVSPSGDVYSFGIIILEMLTQRKPSSDFFRGDNESLPAWVRSSYPHQMLEILAPFLLANLDSIAGTREAARKAVSLVAQVGLLCTNEMVASRPTMYNVVGMLQHIKAGVDKTFGSFRSSRSSGFYDALSRNNSVSSQVSSSADEGKDQHPLSESLQP